MHKMLLQAADRSGDAQHELHVERAARPLCQQPGGDAPETSSAATEGIHGENSVALGQEMMDCCTQGLLRATIRG